jgi:hypothetical protein
MGILQSMRKRRVGVTARSRQIVGSYESGFPQVVTEMAAPLETRTPTGTCSEGCNQSADGSMVTMAQGTTRQKTNPERRERDALGARMRRCLILRQGARPPETPAPFPSGLMFRNGSFLSRVRKPRNNGAPLTESSHSGETTEMRERGPSELEAHTGVFSLCHRSGDGALKARMRRCLILRWGLAP